LFIQRGFLVTAENRIAAVILAAGNSERMGSAKALLKIGSVCFLEHIVKNVHLAGLEPIVVVVGRDAEQIQATVAKNNITFFIRNPAPDRGQLSSFRLALRKLPADILGCFLILVDQPLVKTPTYQLLSTKARQSTDRILIPVCRGRRGHPVYFSKRYFASLLTTPLNAGARFVVRKFEQEVQEIQVDDDGILVDIDTPFEYQKHLG
jgi:molybdenum cofactor cytidylyltransferase